MEDNPVCSVAVAQVFEGFLWIMEKVLTRYEGNGSSRYDGKEYFEAALKLKREKNSRGPLKNGEQVTVKTKTRVWRAAVVDVKPEAPPKPKKRRTADKCEAAIMVTSDVVLASFPLHKGDPVTQPSTTTPDAKIQYLLLNSRITGPVHLASELAKLLFTEEEMAASTLTE